jgi:hypothetical protein
MLDLSLSSLLIFCKVLRLPPTDISGTMLLSVTLLYLLLLPFTLAQFGNFFQHGFPFGGGHFQSGQQEAPRPPGRQHKGWTEMESGVSICRDLSGRKSVLMRFSALSRRLCMSGVYDLRADSCGLPLPLSVSHLLCPD